MSLESQQAAREFIEAFNQRDIDAMVQRTTPGCVITALRSAIEGSFVGHDGVREWVGGYLEAVPDAKISVELITAVQGGRVVVLGRQSGTTLGGAPFDGPLASLAEVEAGLLKRLTAFSSHAEALEAAGLSE
ncbi:MAG: nuclear transport factor 2 family protein [Actinomycetota bacterium]|nr:nuclear transport factor 2 family protein [Actinomycetota bacterium]